MSLVSFWRATGATLGAMVPLTAFLSFATRNSGNITGLGSLLILLLHAIVAIIALPFVIIGFKTTPPHLFFERIVLLEAAVSFAIMFVFVMVSPELREPVTLALIGNGVFFLLFYKSHHVHKEKIEFEQVDVNEQQIDF